MVQNENRPHISHGIEGNPDYCEMMVAIKFGDDWQDFQAKWWVSNFGCRTYCNFCMQYNENQEIKS